MVNWIIGAIIGVIVVISTFLVLDPNVSITNQNNVSNSSEVVDGEKKTVSIQAAVISPGTYTLSKDATLKDLIEKAGGIVSSADVDCYDESVAIMGHDSFYIPYISGFSQECVQSTIEKVCINTATKDELATVNGISATIAQNIVAYREENGLFTCLEDLINVSGIGIKTFERIRDYISLK